MAIHPLWNPYELPTDDEIKSARVPGGVSAPVAVEVVDADPDWPQWYLVVRDQIRVALGDRALTIDHIGSTSVPGLPAKPIIDVDLTVVDSAAENDWLPELETVGFTLKIREPEWEEHRALRGGQPPTNLHVFSPGAREPTRHLLFRDWLRNHPQDRDRYGEIKRHVAADGYTDAMLYNNAKAWFIYDLYEVILTADPAHQHHPQPRHPRTPGLTRRRF